MTGKLKIHSVKLNKECGGESGATNESKSNEAPLWKYPRPLPTANHCKYKSSLSGRKPVLVALNLSTQNISIAWLYHLSFMADMCMHYSLYR